MIGLDHAGKTTLLERIKTHYGKTPGIPIDKINPTIGMNLARVFASGSQVIIWDLGGQIKMRTMWERYYDEAHAIMFVVDSADLGRLEEAKLAYGELSSTFIWSVCCTNVTLSTFCHFMEPAEAICDHDSVSNIPVIIVANKQDLPVSTRYCAVRSHC